MTYIVDRNVNYTNVCTTSCRFCAFTARPGTPSTSSRGKSSRRTPGGRRRPGESDPAQGNSSSDLQIKWADLLFTSDEGVRLGLHAHPRRSCTSAASRARKLCAASSSTASRRRARQRAGRRRRDPGRPGPSQDREGQVHEREWLGVMRVAHQMGLRSRRDDDVRHRRHAPDRVGHLLNRDLRTRPPASRRSFVGTSSTNAGFIRGQQPRHGPLPPATPGRRPDLLDNVDHVGASWVTRSEVGQVALRFGADDFGSVMFEESVVSSRDDVLHERRGDGGPHPCRRLQGGTPQRCATTGSPSPLEMARCAPFTLTPS